MTLSSIDEKKKGNIVENWDNSYSNLKTSYSEEINTLSILSNNVGWELTLQSIRAYLPNNSDTIKVLEVGCGGARTSLYLAQRGFDVTCADFASGALKLAQANFEASGATGTFVKDDLLNSTLPSESFDCVMSFGLLEHFEELDPVINSITALVRPGGIQIHNIITKKFSTYTIMNALWFPLRLIRNLIIKKSYKDIIRKSFRDFPHFENTFSYKKYCESFEDAGNTIMKCSPQGVLFPFLALPLNAGDSIVRRFPKFLRTVFKLTNNTESKILHSISPTFYIVSKKSE
jgi:2-polyprenyl-3-methyl-5-hydroxy-6-metoxy-1,4-benzoquinol methylase